MVKKPAPLQDIPEDIVDDMMRRVIQMAPAFSARLEEIANEVRHDWAGEQARVCYIAKRKGKVLSARNDDIRRDYLAGERIEFLERRYGIGKRWILKIVKT